MIPLIFQLSTMRNLKNLLALFTLGVLMTFTACQPEEATNIDITGTITHASNPVTGVDVVASTGATTTTDANGKYSINAGKDGKLTFSKKGFITKEMDINGQTTIDVTLDMDPWVMSFNSNGNTVMNPQFGSNSIVPGANVSASSPTGAWYTTAPYKGAVAPSTTSAWYDGWSFYSRLVSGTTTSDVINTPTTTQDVDDAWMQAQGTTVTWSKNTLYKLDGFVFVGDGQTLNIEEGTIIQGKAGTGANASALIVTRGGTINANGTAAEPIIFTYDGDQGGTAATQRGQWGGLIILGKAGLNSAQGETQIEGIPTTETRGLYGGTEDNHSSGTVRYVSIRHGGSNIGNDNEINGLTLGGVGSGTTLEYIEVIGNKDDGIEWFGGTAQGKYLITAFCGDDGLDYDEGYRGKNQFVIVHQDAALADRGGEHDGGTSPETGTPFAIPVFWNVTMIGNNTKKTITFRDNAGGKYYNSIFSGFGKGIDIEDIQDQAQDSYKQFVDGNLLIKNCIFHDIAAGTAPEDLFTVSQP